MRLLRLAEHEGEGLDGLAQPHVVRQHRAALVTGEPLHACELITTQPRRQPRTDERVSEPQSAVEVQCGGPGGVNVSAVDGYSTVRRHR